VSALLFLLSLALPYKIAADQTIPTGNVDANNLTALHEQARKLGSEWRHDSINQAVQLYSESAKLYLSTGDSANAAICLREAGSLSLVLGDRELAATYFNSSLAATGKSNFLSERSKTLSELSHLKMSDGQNNESEGYAREALYFAQWSGDQSAVARANYVFGELFYAKGELNRSRNHYYRSISRFKISTDLDGEARALIGLGYVYLGLDRYDLALEVLNAALVNSQTAGNRRLQALTLKAIGKIYSFDSRKRDALNSYKAAEVLFSPDVDGVERASLFNGLAFVYESYGETDLARQYYRKGYEMFVKEGHVYGQVATLPDVARLEAAQMNFQAAADSLETEISLARMLKNDFYVALGNEQLGNLEFIRRDFGGSLDYYRRAKRSFFEQGRKSSILRICIRLGQIYRELGDSDQARSSLAEASKLNEEVNNDFAKADLFYYVALLDQDRKDYRSALQNVQASVKLSDDISTRVVNSNLSSSYISGVFERYELNVQLLMQRYAESQDADFKIQAFQIAERAKARSMVESLQLAELDYDKNASPESLALEKETRASLNLSANKLSELIANNAGESEIEQVENELRGLEHELAEQKAVRKQNSPAYAAVRTPSAFSVSEFQEHVLDNDSLVLEYWLGAEQSYLWLIGKDSFESYILPARSEIESHVDSLLDAIRVRESNQGKSIQEYNAVVTRGDEITRLELRQLSEVLLGQVVGKIAGKRLIVVPDGKLSQLPFSALPLPHSNLADPILLTNEVNYEPSARVLAQIVMSKGVRIEPTKDIRVFADPVFSDDDDRLGYKVTMSTPSGLSQLRSANYLESLRRLPASQIEAEGISSIFRDAKIETGFSANRDTFLETETSDFKVLHFATHGLLDNSHPELSGIVLSLYDQNRVRQDGFIRLQDIYGTSVNAELVVISACESGGGKEQKGNGIASLSNAFLSVGARSVVSSLWKVDDDATHRLMETFYRNMLENGLPPARALRESQISLMTSGQYKSPFYWAAFTVSGRYNEPLSVSRKGNLMVWGSVFAGVAVFICILLWRRRAVILSP
jgi:CHAT domain-containing protein/Flp pilus assembly protein TadD